MPCSQSARRQGNCHRQAARCLDALTGLIGVTLWPGPSPDLRAIGRIMRQLGDLLVVGVYMAAVGVRTSLEAATATFDG